MTASGQIAGPAMRHVFVHDMVLSASIGIYPHEHAKAQRVRVNVDCGVPDGAGVGRDDLPRVVSYERIAQDVRRIVGAGHVKLVETLAERIAEACLADNRVSLVRVRVEKLDVFTDAASAGVEIERYAATCPLGVVDSQQLQRASR